MFEHNIAKNNSAEVVRKADLKKTKKEDPGLAGHARAELDKLKREGKITTDKKLTEKRQEMIINEIIAKSGVIVGSINLQNEAQGYPPTKWDAKTSETIRISGSRLPLESKRLDAEGINEYIKFEPVARTFSEKRPKTEKKFFGIIKKQVDEEIGYTRQLTQAELVKNGSVEPAVVMTYSAADSLDDHGDYKVPDGRGGNFLMVKLILPKSLADEAMRLIQKDPKSIRKIIEGAILKKGVATKEQWERGDNNGSPMRPPYEKWQNNKKVNKIYIEQKGEGDFEFRPGSVLSTEEKETVENPEVEATENKQSPRETAGAKDKVDTKPEAKGEIPKPPGVESKKAPPKSDGIGLLVKDISEGLGKSSDQSETGLKVSRQKKVPEQKEQIQPWFDTEKQKAYEEVLKEMRDANNQGKNAGQYLSELIEKYTSGRPDSYGTQVRFGNWMKPKDLESIGWVTINSQNLNDVVGMEIDRPIFVVSDKKVFEKLASIFNASAEGAHGIHIPDNFLDKHPAWSRVGIILAQYSEEIFVHEASHSVESKKRGHYDYLLSELFAYFPAAIIKLNNWNKLKEFAGNKYYYDEYTKSAKIKKSFEEWQEMVDTVIDKCRKIQNKSGNIILQRLLAQSKSIGEFLEN